jgi:uncharacterized radical SAM superfamily Fe-S cluster-containing enzyme
VFERLNRIRPNPGFTPHWSDRPLLKSWQKDKPPLGWPRETESLCPVCVREARQEILDGRMAVSDLPHARVGEIKATILERDGRILMVKDCLRHGHFDDVLSIDVEFFRRVEASFPGSDFPSHRDEGLHRHGSSSIRYGRGAVLNVDLTNRCNMMCDPCFTDANQVGFVHELSWDDITHVLDHGMGARPRRQMSVQFTGGEPTLHPRFLDAVRYANKLGYKSVQAATNGIEFATRPEFCRQAAEAGLRFVYLQLDGIGEAANAHRKVGNLFQVKLRAIENLWNAGVDIVPVTTVINGVNNEQVGRIVRFALDNPSKISLLAFQPVSFTGRDEEISDERRAAQRYTTSHLAHDVARQAGLGAPARDWLAISAMATFADWADLVHGPQAQWGHLACGCHPDCGAGMLVVVDKVTKQARPLTQFLHPRLFEDITRINDAARGKALSVLGMVLAVLRNYDPFEAPREFRLIDVIFRFDKAFGATRRDYGRVGAGRTRADIEKRRADRWCFLFIAGMWFQDLFTYDFRRTERCIVPYATEEGEISFCAYNTGIGWRQIVEQQHMTATLAKWYAEHDRHPIYTGGHRVDLESAEHSLHLDPQAMTAERQTDLEEQGIARTARDEKLRARDEARQHGPDA